LNSAAKKPSIRTRKPRAPGRPTLATAQLQREALLNHALEEFLQHGFEGANIDRIARNAGIGRATIYRQFGSKETLFQAATTYRTTGLRERLNLLITSSKPPREILLELIEQIHIEFTGNDLLPVARLSIAEARRFPDACRNLWSLEAAQVLAPLAQYLRQLKDQGILDIGEPETAALHIANMAIGGFRFLIEQPLKTRAARKQWAEGVLQVILPALHHPQ
jgi:TetR/AcrR family transcriptional repressor of mexJK operon